jgi:peptidoglycan hydrolase-like protein with peptidoglycan-binding domain
MPRILWLADRLRAAGLKVAEVPGWQTRGSATFAPRVVVCHHTAGGRTGNAPSLTVVRDGRPGIPGPLSQLVLGRDGTFYVVASGRANHAGLGGWRGVSGNTASLGIEAENAGDGVDPWPDVQVDAYVRGAAAICDELGLPSDMVCAHREWAPARKVDPRGIDMALFRARVAAVLAGEVPRPVPIPAVDPAGRRTLRYTSPMMHGADVAALQRAVGVQADGWFGAKTSAALREFQRAHGLVPDAIAGPRTFAVLDRLLLDAG